jgi:NAD-dependent dihydropyrimidine dehydrogenase PreA subunit
VDFCNVDAIAVNDERGVLEVVALEDCIECHSCQQNCPEGAIMVFPQVEDSLKNL